MKKLFTFLLALLTGVGTIFAESGKCGPNLTWDLTDGVLTISGTGSMTNYYYYEPSLGKSYINSPWYSYRSSIDSIRINEGVTSIGDDAFAFCSRLTSVTIPNSVTSIGNGAFWYCTGLTAVYISDLAAWCKIQYGDSESNPLYYAHNLYVNGELVTDLVIPEGVTSISDWAFTYCSGLTSVTIPNSVTSIGERAFMDCSSLTSVTIGNSVTSIGNLAFYGCSGLTSVTIPESVTSIGESAFSGCTGLSSFVFLSAVPPTIESSTFGGSKAKIYVPCDTKEDYINAWKKFVDSKLINYLPAHEISVSFDANSGNVKTVKGSSICETTATITAEAKTGYHFVQWNDGNNENPRTIILTQDTSFTAEFAKNRYSITAVPNDAYQGSVTGGGVAEYLDQMTLTAVPQTGYHFEYWENKSNKYYDNPLTVTAREDATFTAYFALTIYNITTKADLTQGRVTAPAQSTFIEPVTMTAVPNTGYEFVQWNDGNTDNPRTVVLTQDTTFTAEFAKSKYTIITKSDNESQGTTNGNTVAEYSEKVSITAEAQYGYHFDYWEAGENKYYENPLTITVKGDTTFTAVFAPNVYSIVTKADATEGTITATSTQANYLEEVTITAIPNNGYEFVQWNDGNTDNPRTVVLTQDTTFTALFETVVSGTCGENDALTWSYDREKAELSIAGKGKLNSNFTYGIEAPENAICLVVGEDITAVSSEAFKEFSKLQTVTWNATNCEIAGTPFQNTITTMIFGEKVDKVPSYICYKLSNLNSVTIPNSVTNIGKYAFSGCESLTSVYISDLAAWCKIQFTDDTANPLSNAHNLYVNGELVTDLVIPNSITSIGDYAFYGCSSLSSVTIPNSVTSIGSYAFYNCTSLTAVHISDLAAWCKIQFYEPYANPLYFAHNLYVNGELVTDLVIPNSVTSIGEGAFLGCSGLTSVTIPNSVTSIGKGAFEYCSSLTSVEIPNSVTSIGVGAFYECSSLTSVTIPNSVTSIGSYAFYECASLTSVTIPNSVTSIGEFAFCECASLTSVTIPNSVTSIGEYAFYLCTSLTSVIVGNGVKEIVSPTFAGCPLKNITLGTGLRKMSVNAFTYNVMMDGYDEYGQPMPKTDAAGNIIYTVEKVVCYAKVPPTIELSGTSDYKKFLDNFAEAIIYVPQESVSRYQAYTETWGRLDIRPIKAESVTTDNLVITPSENSADIVWPAVTGAATYELVIKDKQGNIICTLVFNANGQLASIAFSAPARGDAPQQTQAAGFSFTVTGLDSGSSYDLTMASKDEKGNTIDEKHLSFSTTGNSPEAINTVETSKLGGSTKILRNGQVFIQRDSKLYTVQGQKVR